MCVLKIQGAREHNLKNIDLVVPRNQFVVFTGVSGSGKSSLAFDTLYAEGQRRYVESLSVYARQFLELMPKPDVDSIEGLSPAIAIEQKTTSNNPRSTVGTVTDVYDYLRLLFARVGTPHSPTTGEPIEAQSVSHMVEHVLALAEGTRLYLLAPLVRQRKGGLQKEIIFLTQRGFQRLRLDGVVYSVDDVPEVDKNKKHTLEVVVDRLILKKDQGPQLADAFETALSLSQGVVWIENIDTKERFVFSSRFSCPVSGFSLEGVAPALFSFNSPLGACAVCNGLGLHITFDERLIVPNKTLSLKEGAVAPWRVSFYNFPVFQALSGHYNFSLNTPFQELDPAVQRVIFYGTGKNTLPFVQEGGGCVHKPFEGVIPLLEKRWKNQKDKPWAPKDLAAYQVRVPCGGCGGHRLKPEALCVKIQGLHIGDVTRFSIDKALEWVGGLEGALVPQKEKIAKRLLHEVCQRLSFLKSVGLGYLSLNRESGTLSGGEGQRIRLASQIGSGLTGVLYVLDEPSIGLHQRDNDRLIQTLQHLKQLGNTVIVVEHDEDTILQADYVVDIGPGAGSQGGYVVAHGSPAEVIKAPQSLTGAYLRKEKTIPLPQQYRSFNPQRVLCLKNAHLNNLKNLTVSFPLGCFVAVSGVSGGGKSSLVMETLYEGLHHFFSKTDNVFQSYQSLEGVEHLDKVIHISQQPIGRTPRSNPATYTGVFTPIREWFSQLPEAKARGYGAGRFSFNVKGGRCEACEGEGVLKIEMHFLPDVYVDCDTCQGKRYNKETLDVRYKGQAISDVLRLTVDDAQMFFDAVPAIYEKLALLSRVGLGYVQIGQSATTLSGGEAQRVKLSKELSRRSTGRTLYILDEPTTGLHFEDIRKLLEILHSLVDQGNTVIVIEHNLDVVKTADWVFDLGPQGGEEGGHIVAQGTPYQLTQNPHSITGPYLKKYFAKGVL